MKTLLAIVTFPVRMIIWTVMFLAGLAGLRRKEVVVAKPTSAKGFSFWKLTAGFICGLVVVGILFSAGVIAREKFRGELFRLADRGEMAYFSRIEKDERGNNVVYVMNKQNGPECFMTYHVIDQRILTCRRGDEVVFTKMKGFVPTRSGFAREVAATVSTKTSETVSNLISIDEVQDESPRVIYEGEPVAKKVAMPAKIVHSRSYKRVVAKR